MGTKPPAAYSQFVHSCCLAPVMIGAVLLVAAFAAIAAETLTPMDQFMVKRGYTVVPLRRGRDNHLFATAKINGKRAACQIDTGAPDIILDTRRGGGLKPLGRTATPAYGILGRYASGLPTVWIDRFELSGVLFSNQEAVVSNLHRDSEVPIGSYIPSSRSGESTDAIIGMSLLRNMHAWLDCYAPRLYVRLEKPDRSVEAGMEQSFGASGYLAAPVTSMGTDLLVHAMINGQPAFFIIDTGSFDTVVALDQLDAYGLSNQEQLGKFVDLGGTKSDLKYTRPESLQIGDFELKRYPIGTVNMPLLTKRNPVFKTNGLPPLVGLLGPDVLDRSRALIDCAGGRMFLMPEKKSH